MDLSQLLQVAKQGDTDARSDLVRLAYEDLRRLAHGQMRSERLDHSLTATALVHEVSARLLEQSRLPAASRDEFLAYVAKAMRNLLIDHARAKNAIKRGRGGVKLQLDEALAAADEQPVKLLELDEALSRLSEIDSRRARVVEMRYFAGMSIEETAETLGVSAATVKRDWQVARLWLARELDAGEINES